VAAGHPAVGEIFIGLCLDNIHLVFAVPAETKYRPCTGLVVTFECFRKPQYHLLRIGYRFIDTLFGGVDGNFAFDDILHHILLLIGSVVRMGSLKHSLLLYATIWLHIVKGTCPTFAQGMSTARQSIGVLAYNGGWGWGWWRQVIGKCEQTADKNETGLCLC